jgi:pilus assembly protein Flp/PilA
MRKFLRTLPAWLAVDSESGVTAIEYGLIAALIAVVIIAGVTLVGTNLSNVFNGVAGHLVLPT